jgi:hypothetical protein
MVLIEYPEARDRIEGLRNREKKIFLKAAYLLACTGDELCGKLVSGVAEFRRVNNIVYGPKGTDVVETTVDLDQPDFNLDDIIKLSNQLRSKEFNVQQVFHSLSTVLAGLFYITNAKQKMEPGVKLTQRIVALPLSGQYDPWVKEIFDYFKEKGEKYVFDFNRQHVHFYLTHKEKIFNECTYKIKKYKTQGEGKAEVISEHERDLVLDGLRYLRQDELMEKYKFDWVDFEAFTGLKFSNKYLLDRRGDTSTLDWHRYIKKLCVAYRA